MRCPCGTLCDVDVLICEDDPVARSVISDLVEDHGGQVMAAVDAPLDAMAFLERFSPDVVILDVLLHHGSGLTLVEHVRRRHPDAQIVIFTAYDSMVHLDDDSIEVVVKPDFERLGRILTSSSERGGERRKPVRHVNVPPGPTNARAFYQLVAAAQPDDVLVSVAAEGDAGAVADDLRRALRSHDVVLERSDQVVALLLGGGDETVRALQLRLEQSFPALAPRTTSTLAGADPIDSFSRLTST